MEILQIVNRLVPPEGDIELTAAIEPTETVKARAIEIVKELRCLRACALALRNQLIEALAISVEDFLAVFSFESNAQSALNPPVEVNEMLIDVTQEGRCWL